jgi:DNA-directed RNA polymerase sigma subunit (sigma70/sigma32)
VRQIEQKALEKLKVSMHRQLNERPTERPVIG